MPSTNIDKMKHKAENLRTIITLIEGGTATSANKTAWSNYINNLQFILVCLLDSMHDFEQAGRIIKTTYINHIITLLRVQATSLPGTPAVERQYIINWINGWNNNPVLFPDVGGHTTAGVNNTGSISELIGKAGGNAAPYVSFLLDVDSVNFNRYSGAVSRPYHGNAVHNDHIAVINDYGARMTDSQLFFDSLQEAKVAQGLPSSNNKFFTIRDNGFLSYIFYDRDSNGSNSLTDTIYTGPGKWDTGGCVQNIENATNLRECAYTFLGRAPVAYADDDINDIGWENYQIDSNNILERMQDLRAHTDGVVLGFQSISIIDFPHRINNSMVRFTIRIYHANTYFEYTNSIHLQYLQDMDKSTIKTGTKAILRGSNNISNTVFQDVLEPYFNCDNWPLNPNFGAPRTGAEVITFALDRQGEAGRKNKMMLIGCLLDIKRSGDFMQSASVQGLQTQLTFTPSVGLAQPRQGIFATNDRIAAYISAKIHNNATMLSIARNKDDLNMVAIWNMPNKTVQGISRGPPPRPSIRPEDISTENRVVTTGGTPWAKLRSRGPRRALKRWVRKTVGVPNSLTPINNLISELQHTVPSIANDFNSFEIKSMTIDYNTSYRLAQCLYKFYVYIREHQELLTNLFKSYFSNKITDFSNKITDFKDNETLTMPPEKKSILGWRMNGGQPKRNAADMDGWLPLLAGDNDQKKFLIQFTADNVFKRMPNFIEKLDIIHLKNNKVTLSLADIVEKKWHQFSPTSERAENTEVIGDQVFSDMIYTIYNVYHPYIYILNEIFKYQEEREGGTGTHMDIDTGTGTETETETDGEDLLSKLVSKGGWKGGVINSAVNHALTFFGDVQGRVQEEGDYFMAKFKEISLLLLVRVHAHRKINIGELVTGTESGNFH